MSDFNAVNDQMLEMFLFEASSLLEQLDEILLVCEKQQSLAEDDVNEIFRIMHTIKGSSAMMDFHLVSTVTHRLEDTFSFIRENGIDDGHFTRLFDLILDASDFLKAQLDVIQRGEAPAGSNDALIQRITSFLEELDGGVSAAIPQSDTPVIPPPPAEPPEMPELKEDRGSRRKSRSKKAKRAAEPEGGDDAQAPEQPASAAQPEQEVVINLTAPIFQVDVLFEEDCGMENLRAFMLINLLKEHGTVLSYDPPDIESNPETASHIMINGFTIVLESGLTAAELRDIAESAAHVKSAVVAPLSLDTEEPSGVTGDRYAALVRFDDECGMENLRAFMLLNYLRPSCRIISFTPSDIESNPQTAGVIMQNGFSAVLETPMTREELVRVLEKAMHVKSVDVHPLTQRDAGTRSAPEAPAAQAAPARPAAQPVAQPVQAATAAATATAAPPQPTAAPDPAPAAPQAPQPEAAKAAAPKGAPAKKAPVAAGKPIKQNIINVNLAKLDELMDIMGELVITESMVTRSPDLRNVEKLDGFHKAARQLRKLTDEMQDLVMSIRMVPVASTFHKMQRIVRDMSRTLGKEADLVTMGEETDIDKTIIDGIADPIMHLVRNAMDHGLETPEERVAADKPARGTITLAAQNTGGEILITVSDDGKGLDPELLLSKAKDKGLTTKAPGDYTDKEIFNFLTLPGFSTKEKVTQYSGRGVGMDVVRKNIEKVGGTITIESKKGYGMTVFLKIPLTLAIVDGMEISVGSGVYTLQITSINESFKATQEDVIVDTEGNEMIMIRGDCLPIIRLHELYGVEDAVTNVEDGILIWVESGDEQACLFADSLIGEQQIVVKPLPNYLRKFDIKPCGISGCTILGDGNISLILDVGRIIETSIGKR